MDLMSLLGPPTVVSSVAALRAIVEKAEGEYVLLSNLGAGVVTVDQGSLEEGVPVQSGDSFNVAYDGGVYGDSEEGFEAAVEASKPFLPTPVEADLPDIEAVA